MWTYFLGGKCWHPRSVYTLKFDGPLLRDKWNLILWQQPDYIIKVSSIKIETMWLIEVTCVIVVRCLKCEPAEHFSKKKKKNNNNYNNKKK
jgi:hypothetical protein